MATTNKTRAWRPTEEFYRSLKDRFPEGISDTAMLNIIAEEWLVHQSATPSEGSLGELLQEIQHTLESLPALIKDELT